MLDPDTEAWVWADSLDALAAAPETHRLLFENDEVRVLDTRIAPGQTTELHTHLLTLENVDSTAVRVVNVELKHR